MTDDSQISALERLSKLRDSGTLTQEEFEGAKAKVMATPPVTAPFYRKLWFVVLLTCLVLTFPIALFILVTGNVYRHKNGAPIPMGNTARYVYASVLGLWLAAVVINVAVNPKSMIQRWAESAPDKAGSPSDQTASNGAAAPDTCESSDAADMVKSAIEQSATSKIISAKVLDFGRTQELFLDRKNNIRYCAADGELNTGASKLSYKLYFGPSGGELVEVREGEDAFGAKEMAAEAAALAQTAPIPTPKAAPESAPPPESQQKIALPNFTDSESYSSVRTKMINAGWEPFHAPDADQCSEDDKRCIGRPEMESCAGTGRANCKFLWKKNDNITAICTVGEEDATFDVICSYP